MPEKWGELKDRSRALRKWQSRYSGHGYDAICNTCETKFSVSEGSGMIAMPLHCDSCGKGVVVGVRAGGTYGRSAGTSALRMRRDVQSRCQAAVSKLWFVGIRGGPRGSVDDLRLMSRKILTSRRFIAVLALGGIGLFALPPSAALAWANGSEDCTSLGGTTGS
jgi:hypothetical protein